MPRKTFKVIIPADSGNRDAGKTFLVTEQDAVATEEFALRAGLVLTSNGIHVPREMVEAGFVGLAFVVLQALSGAREETVLPLWREMLTKCVQFQHSEALFQPFDRSHVEEVSTLLLLRKTIVEIHLGFPLAEFAARFAKMSSALSPAPNNSSPIPSDQSPAA